MTRIFKTPLAKKGRLLTGFTIIELIIYIAIVGVVAIVTINTTVSLQSVLRHIRLERRVTSSAETAMRRLLREIHLANTVHASSTLDASPGILSMASVESETDAAPKNAMFYTDAGALMFRRATSAPVTLTGGNVTVTNLVFRQITNGTTSVSVKVELTLRAQGGNASTTASYYTTSVLKGSY